MKKLWYLVLLLPVFVASAGDHKKSTSIQLKSKASQQKVFRHHEKHWHQPRYSREVTLFRCVDSWGHRISGKFVEKQRYFIELGGGSCRRVSPNAHHYGAIDKVLDYNFPADNVYRAIARIKQKYGLRNARVIESENIVNGRKNFKYTLVFKTGRYGFREFRVKQSRRNGTIKKIYEV